MGEERSLNRYEAPAPVSPPPFPRGLKRRRPRTYVEWKILKRWGELPSREEAPVGYLLREARERADLTQAELGERLGVSQQAVAQIERWDANPTVSTMRRWAEECGREIEIRLIPAALTV